MVIPSGPLAAIACIQGEGKIRGVVKFYPVNCGTLVFAEILDLPENFSGFYAIHIHEGDNCSGGGFSGTGGHYNPDELPHPRHRGDLPLLLSQNGRAVLAAETNRFTVWEAVGKTVVIHSEPDDYHSQPAGNAGRKIACGIIHRC